MGSSWFIVGIDIIGIIGFLAGFYFSRKNDYLTKFASAVWWVFSILCIIGIIWVIFLMLDLESISLVFYSFFVGFLTCFLFVSYKEKIKLF